MYRYFLIIIVSLFLTYATFNISQTKAEPPLIQEKVSYSKQIAPILRLRCSGCHGPNVWWGAQYQRGLDVTNYKSLMNGGESGPTVVPGQPENSSLIKKIDYQGKPKEIAPDMPFVGKPLPRDQIELIKQWIKEGAVQDHVDLPSVRIQLDDVQITRDKDRTVFDDIYETFVCHIPVESYVTIILSDPSTGKEITRTGGGVEKISPDQDQDLGMAATTDRWIYWPLSRFRNNNAPTVKLPDVVSVELIIEQYKEEPWGAAFVIERANLTERRNSPPFRSRFVKNPVSLTKDQKGEFTYELDGDANVNVEIVRLDNQRGSLIYQDYKADLQAGVKTYRWNLKDKSGYPVKPGGYVARFRCKGRNRNIPVKDVCIVFKVNP